METLSEENTIWEKEKNSRRADIARETLVLGSSVKREGRQQEAERRKKTLKYDIVEDN